jgi:DNA-binding transcriptional LysR family regulator
LKNLNHLDLNLLKVFNAIYREKSVSLAAERLHLTQPAVSNALNRLRQTLDDQLFVRTHNSMEPTLLAQSIAEPIQQGLKSITSSIMRSMAFDPAVSERTFTILATDVGEGTYIAALMQVLEQYAPNIDIKVLEAPLKEYEYLLEFGYADFAIGKVEISGKFEREHIGSCVYSAILCSKYAKRIGVTEGSVIPYDLYLSLRHIHVLPRVTEANQHPLEVALGPDANLRRVVLTLPHTSVLSEIIPNTTLVGTVPSPAVKPLLLRADLVQAQLPFPTEILNVLLIWHRRQQLDKGHKWLRDQIRTLPMPSWNMLDTNPKM